jgi:DNA-binding transcriptional LysR family regulator
MPCPAGSRRGCRAAEGSGGRRVLHQFDPREQVADIIGTAATYIRNGLGIGFLFPFMLDQVGDSGLATVRIADYDLRWRLYVATSATRPPSAAARALLSLIEEELP